MSVCVSVGEAMSVEREMKRGSAYVLRYPVPSAFPAYTVTTWDHCMRTSTNKYTQAVSQLPHAHTPSTHKTSQHLQPQSSTSATRLTKMKTKGTHIGHDISSSNSPRASSTCAFLAFLSRPSFAVLALDELPLVDFRGLTPPPVLARFLGGDVSSSRRAVVGVGGCGVSSGSA